jgi:ABC-2 type transport system ATP-binding protein
MAYPALRFHQVVKRYAGKPVLDGVDLDVGAGECVGLTGVNGTGKTSLIKCLFDFVSLDGGSIEIDGQPHRRPQSRRPLVFLPERFQPPWYLTGARFLGNMMRLHGRAPERALVEQECALLGLPLEALATPVRQHSKGTSQKLGLAACFLSGKSTLVLDEPMSGLDPEARVLFKARLRRAIDGGATVFFSSHLLADVEELCERMAILHGGRVRWLGSPGDCRAAHQAETLEQAFMKVIH